MFMVIFSFEKEKNKVESERGRCKERSGGSKTKGKLKRESLSVKEFQWSLCLLLGKSILQIELPHNRISPSKK